MNTKKTPKNIQQICDYLSSQYICNFRIEPLKYKFRSLKKRGYVLANCNDVLKKTDVYIVIKPYFQPSKDEKYILVINSENRFVNRSFASLAAIKNYIEENFINQN